MAPLFSTSRLPAVITEVLAPRDPILEAQQASSALPPTAVAGRYHPASIPALASRTVRTAALDGPSRALHARQQTDTIPGKYPSLNAGPDPGTVVGIVLGSVGGFLLLLWLVYTCLQMGGRADTVSSYGTASVVTRKSRRRHSKHHHRSPSRRETVEIRTTSRPPPPQTERVVIEERTERRSQPPPPMPVPPPPMPMPMPMSTPPPPRIVTDDEDEVVVIEEHTPPRRTSHKSRSHRRRSSSARRDSSARRESGFREVDPDRFAGGDASYRDVRRSSRHGR